MALAAGPTARSKIGEHGLPFRGQCPSVTRALPHATSTFQPSAAEVIPGLKHSSVRLWTPVTLTSTVCGLSTLTLKVWRVRPSPTSDTPARYLAGHLASIPTVASNRRALGSSLYTAGKAGRSPSSQKNEMLLG